MGVRKRLAMGCPRDKGQSSLSNSEKWDDDSWLLRGIKGQESQDSREGMACVRRQE